MSLSRDSIRRLRFLLLHLPELEVLDAVETVEEATVEVASVVVGLATAVELLSTTVELLSTTVELVSTEVVVVVELDDVVALEELPSPQNVIRRLTYK